MKNTINFNDRIMNDYDKSWTTEVDHGTDWNKTFKSGTYRDMLYGIVLHNSPQQFASQVKAKSVPQVYVSFFLDLNDTIARQDKWTRIC